MEIVTDVSFGAVLSNFTVRTGKTSILNSVLEKLEENNFSILKIRKIDKKALNNYNRKIKISKKIENHISYLFSEKLYDRIIFLWKYGEFHTKCKIELFLINKLIIEELPQELNIIMKEQVGRTVVFQILKKINKTENPYEIKNKKINHEIRSNENFEQLTIYL